MEFAFSKAQARAGCFFNRELNPFPRMKGFAPAREIQILGKAGALPQESKSGSPFKCQLDLIFDAAEKRGEKNVLHVFAGDIGFRRPQNYPMQDEPERRRVSNARWLKSATSELWEFLRNCRQKRGRRHNQGSVGNPGFIQPGDDDHARNVSEFFRKIPQLRAWV